MLSLKIEQSQADKYAQKMWENVQNQLTRVINNKGLPQTKKRSKIKILQREIKFLTSINNEQKLKEILSNNPTKLRDLIEEFELKTPTIRTKESNLNRVLYNVFVSNGYEHKKFDGLKFVNDIGLQTCPYCNRSYIQSVSKNGVVRPQIDHFYPKSKYPYLGLSFYNLIPSCSICNGTTAKGERDSYEDNLKSPYEIKNDDFQFDFKFVTPDNCEVVLKKKLDINDDYFKIEEFYKHHGDIANELYTKFFREDTKEHFNSLRKSLTGIGLNEDEIYRYLFCNYKKNEDLHKRPLSKLTKDILEQLEII